MAGASAEVLRAKIAGMDCGSCALTIEDGLRQLPGARRVAVDFTTETLELEGEVSREQVERRLRQLGYHLAEAAPAGGRQAVTPAAGPLRFFLTDPQQQVALVATIVVLAVSLFAWLSSGTRRSSSSISPARPRRPSSAPPPSSRACARCGSAAGSASSCS